MQHQSLPGPLMYQRPFTIVGSGSLTSYVWRMQNNSVDCEYRFDLRSHSTNLLSNGYLFRPDELPYVICWVRVLIQELLHDGGLPTAIRLELRDLLRQLEPVIVPSMPVDEDDDGDGDGERDNRDEVKDRDDVAIVPVAAPTACDISESTETKPTDNSQINIT